MLGIQDLALFVISGLLLNIAPGPDSLLIMTRSATQGWRAGSAAALGIGTGTLVHVAAAALGMSAVLATSATAFTLVKYAGAAYLLYLGVGLLLSKPHLQETRGVPLAINPVALPHRKIFMQGFFTNVLNPKVALFFLAFVPQFISPESPNKALTFITLGFIFNFNGMLWCHFLAASTAFASQRIRVNNLVSMWINRLIGAVFVSLGIRLALAESS
jgi:threonine/homoserine/homoserine lactone efflux protein